MRQDPEQRAGPLEVVLFLVLLLGGCAWLSMARDDIRGGRDIVTSLADPGGLSSAPASVGQGAAPRYLPVTGDAPASIAPAPPACPGPTLNSCPGGHVHTTGPCSWICEAVP